MKLLKGNARTKALATAAKAAEAIGKGEGTIASQQRELETAVSSLVAPIGYVTNDDGKRVLNAPTQARVAETRSIVTLHYTMGRLGLSEADASAVIKLKGYNADKAGEKGFRTEAQHLAVRAAREGNSNAKRTGSNPPENKGQFDSLPEAVAPKPSESPIYDSKEAFDEHVMHVMNSLMQASKKAAQKKVLSNNASTVIEDAFNAAKIKFG